MYSQHDLDQIALKLNSRPRKTLDYSTPADTLAKTVALTSWIYPPIASERDEEKRGLWRWLASRFDAKRLVFVDESGFSISMTRLRLREPRGRRAYGKVPRNRGKNQTLIASVTLEGGMGECMCVKGGTDAPVFETYVEKALAPSLIEGQVVVLDGLGAHQTARVRELIEGRGCDLVFLPSYSPDLNPIEEAFSKIKETRQESWGANAGGAQ